MQKLRSRSAGFGTLALLFSVFGCNQILGLNKISVRHDAPKNGSGGTSNDELDGSTNGLQSGSGGAVVAASGGTPSSRDAARGPDAHVPDAGGCTTNAECTTLASASGDGATIPAVCVKPERRCAMLLSPDCQTITGDPSDDSAIIVGSLFSTKGTQGATNLPRQQSATLAISEINAAGGIPAAGASAAPRKLVMVSCDESTDLMRAGAHLVTDLHVPAIVGPNTSQDTIALSQGLTIGAGTVLMTPTGVASSIADLLDDDLTWLMVPTDTQRAPLMISQINDIESALRAARQRQTLRLGIVFRNDALGIGTRTSLNALVFNGKSLSDPSNLGANVKISPYDPTQPDQAAIVSAYVDFAPDVVVLAGTAEAVTKVMVPLEVGWRGGDSGASAAERPYYVLIDSAKVPELITAVTGNDDLRRRVRGTGVTPDPESAPVLNAFKVDYLTQYPSASATISGMGPSYDATYAIAYAIAGMSGHPVTGPNVAQGLRKLAGGQTTIDIENTQILAAFQALVEGQQIHAIGTFGPLDWDKNGAVVGGTIEMWCIGGTTTPPAYGSSGLVYDIATGQYHGAYTPCAP